jgi:hypothetical protein
MHLSWRASGFPRWLRLIHYINLLFLELLIRSGLQILGCIRASIGTMGVHRRPNG